MPHFRLSIEHEEPDVLSYTLKIMTSEKNSSLGYIRGYLFNLGDEELLMDSADSIDTDTEHLMSVFCELTLEKDDDGGTYAVRVAVIDKVFIEPAFRNMGIATLAMKSLLDMLQIMGGEIAILHAFPYNLRDQLHNHPDNLDIRRAVKAETKQLVRFYHKFGFNEVPSDLDGAYMWLDISETKIGFLEEESEKVVVHTDDKVMLKINPNSVNE